MDTGENLRKYEANPMKEAVAQLHSRHDRALMFAFGGVIQIPKDKPAFQPLLLPRA